ncbi:hypothetical protein [Candidatus Hamiltonella endosymbiont of Tuberolachnus salignus]|uniref:hypothetical protein n=1 Tax=Candidatus Williamhamiltonella endosymbiont of Tuberolachnus salignus TaxID=3077954 RepID=UPI0030CF8E87
MTDLTELSQWEDGIYQIETRDPVLGGPEGIANRQAQQLGNRTTFLKEGQDRLNTEFYHHREEEDPHPVYALKKSPDFTGEPKAPTPKFKNSSRQLATTEFVTRAVNALTDGAPEALDTLKELAKALGEERDFSTQILQQLSQKLSKNDHGADIPDKAQFIQNLGLSHTATLPLGTTQHTVMRGDDERVVQCHDWKQTVKAKELEGEPRYTTTIDLTGLSTERYYPVWWRFPPNEGANNWLTIHRSYATDREKFPFGQDITHLAGLLVQLEGGDTPWGGDAQYFHIKRLHQSYRKTVKALNYRMLCIARPVDGKYPMINGLSAGALNHSPVYSGGYLRGGLTYFVTSSFSHHRLGFSREEGEVEIFQWSYAGGDKIKHKEEDSVSIDSAFEIRFMVKPFGSDDPALGKDYADVTMPYAFDYDKRYQPKK